jgi:hypothetical protein
MNEVLGKESSKEDLRKEKDPSDQETPDQLLVSVPFQQQEHFLGKLPFFTKVLQCFANVMPLTISWENPALKIQPCRSAFLGETPLSHKKPLSLDLWTSLPVAGDHRLNATQNNHL